jgi:hypothetical protein
MRPEHPLIVLTVEALAREFGVTPKALWDAIDGKPTPARLVKALVAAYYPGLREADFVTEGSTSAPNGGIFGAPMQTETIVGAKPTDHPFTRALRARGLTLAEWCQTHDIERMMAKGWYTSGSGARRIPRAVADMIESELGVRATPANWPNGIREEKTHRRK